MRARLNSKIRQEGSFANGKSAGTFARHYPLPHPHYYHY
jgi:hypothetical protein